MIKAILSDLSKVILFAKDTSYTGAMTDLLLEHRDKSDYNFNDFYYVNEEYLQLLESMKEKIQILLFTQGRMLEEPSLKSRLDKTFNHTTSSAILGYDKNDARAFSEFARQMNLAPNEILFIDDNAEFINAAKAAGLQTHTYVDNAGVKDLLGSMNI